MTKENGGLISDVLLMKMSYKICFFYFRTVGEVMSGIVAKCIGAPKAKTKDLATQISLMYIEIEKQDFVMEELLKGTEHKNPKVVAACINVMTLAIRFVKIFINSYYIYLFFM